MPPTDSEQEPGPPANGEELAKLRRRVAELEEAGPRPPRHRLRTTGSVLLIILAAVLSLLAVVAVWANDQVTDTNKFVATMGPLASNPQVQDAMTNRITNLVVAQIDVKSLVDQLSQAASEKGVPQQAANLIGGLTGPITSGLTSLISGVVNKVVTSQAFATIWTDAMRAAHTTMVKALTGQGGGAVSLKNNEVTVDVGPAVDNIKNQLVNSGLAAASKIPTVHTSITVFASKDLSKIRSAVRLLQILGNWLPIIAVLVAAGGVYLAKSRRRALIGAALAIAAMMLLLGIVLAVFRSYFLDHLPADASPGAAGAVYDALVHYMRQSVRVVGVLAVVVALGAFFIGPSRVAVTVRQACQGGVGAIRGVAESVGFRAGPVEPFVRRYKRWIGIGILIGASVIFVVWDNPTGLVVFWFAVIVLLLFAIREFLAPAAGPLTPRAAPAGGAPPPE